LIIIKVKVNKFKQFYGIDNEIKTTMKKILFPTDFSTTSENAFRYTLHIAHKFNACVETIHAYTIPVAIATPEAIFSDISASIVKIEQEDFNFAIRRMHDIALEEGLMNVEVSHNLEEGYAVEEILKMQNSGKFDMIIMGTEGAEGFGRWLNGSHAAKVVGKSDCPVLVIPGEAKYRAIKAITYATDFEEMETNMIDDLLQWVIKFNAELHFVHVNYKREKISLDQYYNMEEIRKMAKDYPTIRFKILHDDSVVDELEEYVDDNNIDMLIMVTHRYPFFKRLFKPSLTKMMTFETEIPLLVYH